MEDLINRFYIIVEEGSLNSINDIYTGSVVYFDPMFEMLENDKVLAMWHLLSEMRSNLKIEIGNINDEGDGYYTCRHTDTYIFSPNSKQIVMVSTGNFKIENGRITEHSEGFSLHKWATQAYGLWANVVGWNRWYQQNIKNEMRRKLLSY